MEQNFPGNPNQTFYENTGFQFNRITKQTLLLDVVNKEGIELKEFDLILPEPLIIDKLSDIYLDSFTTVGAKSKSENIHDVSQNMGFLLKINEFNIQSKIATNIKQTIAPVGARQGYTNHAFNANGCIYIPNDTPITNKNLIVNQNTGVIGGVLIVEETYDDLDINAGQYVGQGLGMKFSLVLGARAIGGTNAVVSAIITNTGTNYRAGEQIEINEAELRIIVGDAATTIANGSIILVIPKDFTPSGVSTTHKGKKMNYVCSINPTTLSQISGKITDMGKKHSGGTTNFYNEIFPIVYNSPFLPPVAPNPGKYPNRFIAEFVIISR